MSEEQDIQGAESQQPDPSEQEARQEGWVSQDEWTQAGKDPDRWKPAKDFLEDGTRINGVLKKRNERLEHDLTALRNDFQQWTRHQAELTARKEREAYDRAKREYEAQISQVERLKQEAIETNDVAAYDRAARLEREVQPPPEPQATHRQQVDPRIEAQMNEWMPNNKWYGTDPEMTQYADTLAAGFATSRRPFSLDDITREVKARFHHKFGNPNRAAAAPVAGAGGLTRPRKKGFSDLPQDAKEAAQRFVKRGLFKSVDDYAASYFGE